VPLLWRIETVQAVAIELARQDIGQIGMPDLIRVFGQRGAMRLLRSLNGVEQAQVYLGGMFGEEGKIYALAIPGGPQRI
jgi:hypothetical protein